MEESSSISVSSSTYEHGAVIADVSNPKDIWEKVLRAVQFDPETLLYTYTESCFAFLWYRIRKKLEFFIHPELLFEDLSVDSFGKLQREGSTILQGRIEELAPRVIDISFEVSRWFQYALFASQRWQMSGTSQICGVPSVSLIYLFAKEGLDSILCTNEKGHYYVSVPILGEDRNPWGTLTSAWRSF